MESSNKILNDSKSNVVMVNDQAGDMSPSSIQLMHKKSNKIILKMGRNNNTI